MDDASPPGIEGLNAGAGDDEIQVYDGLNVVQLGEGADALGVHARDGAPEDPIAVVSDFDVEQDALILGVISDGPDLISDNIQLLDFTAELIQTSLGPATLIVPATDDVDLAATLADASAGVAVLQGVTPEGPEGAEIAIALIDSDHSTSASDGIGTLIGAAVGVT